jgi:hypothetical protein
MRHYAHMPYPSWNGTSASGVSNTHCCARHTAGPRRICRICSERSAPISLWDVHVLCDDRLWLVVGCNGRGVLDMGGVRAPARFVDVAWLWCGRCEGC